MDPLIGLAAGAISQAANAFSTGKMNKATRKWNQMMYAKQRRHNLEDWHMQNEYNSPQQQMARMKAAGLNPNLIYEGNPNVASANVGMADTGNYKPEAPQFDGGELVRNYADVQAMNLQKQMQKENIEQLKKQRQVMDTQMLETNARTANITQDLTLKKELQEYNVDAARLQNIRLETETDVLKQRNAREIVMQSQNIAESIARIAEMEARISKVPHEIEYLKTQIDNGRLDKEFKQIENELAKKNVFKSDPLYARIALLAYDKLKAAQKRKPPSDKVKYAHDYFNNQSRFWVQDVIQGLEGK